VFTYFTGVGDLVRCFQCGIGLKDFSNIDDPLKEHVKHSDSCLFLIRFYGSKEALMVEKVMSVRIVWVCRVLVLEQQSYITAVNLTIIGILHSQRTNTYNYTIVKYRARFKAAIFMLYMRTS